MWYTLWQIIICHQLIRADDRKYFVTMWVSHIFLKRSLNCTGVQTSFIPPSNVPDRGRDPKKKFWSSILKNNKFLGEICIYLLILLFKWTVLLTFVHQIVNDWISGEYIYLYYTSIFYWTSHSENFPNVSGEIHFFRDKL